MSRRVENISFSLIKLQRLDVGFHELCGDRPGRAAHERTLRRLVAELGQVAVPLLARKLAATDDGVAGWAQLLFAQLLEDDGVRPRAVRALRELATGSAPATRSRAAGVLARLDDETGFDGDGADLQRDRSLRELARCLETAAEYARAADLLVGQLDDHELLSFLDEFATGEPRRAASLIDEVVVRDDLDERTRSELRRLRAPLPRGIPPLRMPGAHVHAGRRDDGCEVVIGVVRRPGSQPVRYRALWAVCDGAGAVVDAGYQAEATYGAIERDILRPADEAGFRLRRVPMRTGAGRVAQAARTAIARGYELPRDYYLGRDILGLRDEHWPEPRESEDAVGLLLARAIDLLAVGEHERARPLLARYVARRPDDPEGRANLGVCLLAMGDAAAARDHLRRAAWLAPECAMHWWNLAAAAHASGGAGQCYLALRQYLACHDERPHAGSRAAAAHASTAEYERFARVDHPGVEPVDVARGDEHCARARDLLAAGNVEDAITAYETAVRLVPSHAAALRDLAAAYLIRRRVTDAERCLRRALALRPSDRETRARLEHLTQTLPAG